MRLINPNASANELKTTLMPHSIIHGDAYFAYFNKIWGIPYVPSRLYSEPLICWNRLCAEPLYVLGRLCTGPLMHWAAYALGRLCAKP